MKEFNQLYPVFLKLDQLNTLIVGGGNVAMEKLSFILKSSPNARLEILAKSLNAELKSLIDKHKIPFRIKSYSKEELAGFQIVIGATNDSKANRQIASDAKSQNILVNIADTPDLCDFYLGGIVTKGNLKIGISSNGKSPTIVKRIREHLESSIPDEVDEVILNMNAYRNHLSGDFAFKVQQLNKATELLINEDTSTIIIKPYQLN